MPDVDAAFYFDLASPECYLVAERILHAVPGPAPWIPVLARDLPEGEGTPGFRCAHEVEAYRDELARRAVALGLQPLRLPPGFPFDSVVAQRAATYALQIGRTVPFALAAFRQAYAGGHDLSNPDAVLVAAAACEMHPRAVLAATERTAVGDQLCAATAAAAAAGVTTVPAVRLGADVFAGPGALERAASMATR